VALTETVSLSRLGLSLQELVHTGLQFSSGNHQVKGALQGALFDLLFSHFIFYIQAPDLQRNSGKQKTRESCLRITLIHKIRIQNPLGNSYRTLDYILKVQKMHKKQGIFAQNDGVKRQFTH
jgi:hypothetical protein